MQNSSIRRKFFCIVSQSSDDKHIVHTAFITNKICRALVDCRRNFCANRGLRTIPDTIQPGFKSGKPPDSPFDFTNEQAMF